ncbi:MAG: hypothetical protein JSR52_11310 [Planctomycetes bacterium]|nr:hypothetical protein [Planctomycetota bacterium]
MCKFLVALFISMVILSAHAVVPRGSWSPAEGAPGVGSIPPLDFNENGIVSSFAAWQPPGSATTNLIVGGSFRFAGNADSVKNIAMWDGYEWHSLGDACDGECTIESIVVYNSTLFVSTGGKIRYLSGNSWQTLAVSSGFVYKLLVTSAGDLIAAGSFSTIGGVGASNIARWDGTSWTAIGAGTSGEVNCLLELSNSDLAVGGSFTTAGGVQAKYIAKWNGSTWSAYGSGFDAPVHAICERSNGDLIAAGEFTMSCATSVNRVAKWNSTNWVPLGTGLNAQVNALMEHGGDLYAAGHFLGAGPADMLGISRWTGSGWASLDGGIHSYLQNHGANIGIGRALTIYQGMLVVGGTYNIAGNTFARNIANWNGTNWSPLGTGMDRAISCLAYGSVNGLIAAGEFNWAGGQQVNGIARHDGTNWVPIGTGFGGPSETRNVLAVAEMPNGDIVAGGNFTTSSGAPANYIAKAHWTGSAWIWSAMGSGFNGQVNALAVLSNGDVIAGGEFTLSASTPMNRIARWNGTGWSAIGSGFSDGEVRAIIQRGNGNIVAAGGFLHSNGSDARGIAEWNGVAWSELGQGTSGVVYTVVELQNGTLAVGGQFDYVDNGAIVANNIAIWNSGSNQWETMDGGTNDAVRCIVQFSSGEIVVGGKFEMVGSAHYSQQHLAIWDGAGWVCWWGKQAFAQTQWYDYGPVSLVVHSTDLYAGGKFYFAGGEYKPSFYFGHWQKWSDDPNSCPCDECPCDFNRDGFVDDLDFAYFIVEYDLFDCYDNRMRTYCPADLNCDWVVDDNDFNVFVAAYNEYVCL